jgi:hypothetical protein
MRRAGRHRPNAAGPNAAGPSHQQPRRSKDRILGRVWRLLREHGVAFILGLGLVLLASAVAPLVWPGIDLWPEPPRPTQTPQPTSTETSGPDETPTRVVLGTAAGSPVSGTAIPELLRRFPSQTESVEKCPQGGGRCLADGTPLGAPVDFRAASTRASLKNAPTCYPIPDPTRLACETDDPNIFRLYKIEEGKGFKIETGGGGDGGHSFGSVIDDLTAFLGKAGALLAAIGALLAAIGALIVALTGVPKRWRRRWQRRRKAAANRQRGSRPKRRGKGKGDPPAREHRVKLSKLSERTLGAVEPPTRKPVTKTPRPALTAVPKKGIAPEPQQRQPRVSIERTIDIRSAPETVFAHVSDSTNLHDYVGLISAPTAREHDQEGRAVVEAHEEQRRVEWVSSSNADSLGWLQIDDGENGGSTVRLGLSVRPSGHEIINIDRTLRALKGRLEP